MSAPTTVLVTQPGVYGGMPNDVYHGDPVPGGSLSASGARRLLPPSCPALYQHHLTSPRRTAAFDFGHAAHRHVLGEGQDLVVVDAPDWRTKAAREQRDQAYADGRTPLLADDHAVVVAMADALRAHPIAGRLFAPGAGRPEQSLFWTDSGIWRRARLDWLPDPGPGRMILPDYKTCHTAAPDELDRVIHDRGYHQQAAWYEDAITALGLHADPVMVLVFQEKAAPYLVTVAQPDAMAMRIGRDLNRRAIDTYRTCVQSGHWPGYSDDVELIGLPGWAENRYLQEIS